MPSRIPFAAALLPCPVAALQAAESDVITAPRIESFPREGAGYALIDWRLPTKPLCEPRHIMISHPHLRRCSLSAKAACFALIFCTALVSGETAMWKTGDGTWTDAAKWGGSVPAVKTFTEIAGGSRVVFDGGDAVVARIDLGTRAKSDATLVLNGGSLGALEMIDVGEYADSHGSIVVNGGRLCATEIGIAGLNEGGGESPACRAEMEVRGGSVLAKYLTLGWRAGSTARLRVVGSKADAIVALNSLDFCIPTGATGSDCEVRFDLDAEGVTPLTLLNKTGHIALSRKDRAGKCALRVGLLAAPPRGDVVLMRATQPCIGTFAELPEGSTVSAEHAGRAFEWTLTYRGGNGNDVALIDPHEIIAGKRIAYTSGKQARVVSIDSAAIKKTWGEMFARSDLAAPPDGSGTRAFPGAEGHGAFAIGGRGGKVIAVTNLDDSGPGSLRAAIDAKGPRTVIFRVGGTIALKTKLVIREPFITIAGQTAPGDGICIRGAADTLTLHNTHDVIVRCVRVRTGFTGTGDAHEGDSITAYNADNFILDHCSTSWGTDETLSCTQGCDRYTVQWCIIAEGLDFYGHSMASILGGDRSSWHHNLFAHCRTRNPRFAGMCRCDFRNNVIYDWGATCGYGDFRAVNYVGNFAKPGPSTTQKPPRFLRDDSYTMPGAIFMQGNVMHGFAQITGDNRSGSMFESEVFATAPRAAPPVITQSADEAFALVLKNAGAISPRRDATDARIVGDVRDGTGKIIRNENELGAWPAYKNGEAPLDSDGDGIPDDWERAHGLNPNDPDDANRINADGCTNLEHWLNSLVPPNSQP